MQGSSPWYTPTTSALHNQQTDNSNYFYSYNQSWERSANGYQQEYYNRPGQYPNNMRTCNENQGFGVENGNYQCPPMYFRQDTVHAEGSSTQNARPRTDRSHPCSQNGNNPNCVQPTPNNSRGRHSKGLIRPNDSEVENFSSVFTQSLTSLYSQDTEANFEDKNYKCDPDAPPNDSELANSIRPKTEDLSNTCNTEYSFSSVFNTDMDQQQHPPGMNSFENLKVKQEFPDIEIENNLRYDNYSLDDTYLKRRRSLAEAYNRKRKRSSVPSMSYRTPVDVDNTDTKASEMFHSQSQWIPNSIQACHTNETSSNDTYQTSEFSSTNQSANYDAFENARGFKRHSVKPRGSRGRPSTKETRVQNAIKRIPKKVSPLTVYAKVLDDRILEVTCRRYKKRTKPSASEENFGGQNQHDTGFSRVNESWEATYHSVGKVVRHLVDKVTALSVPKRTIDLSLISPMKAKELLLRFCSDYTLDYRDFQDFNEVLRTNVVKENEENITRNRKVRTTFQREECNTTKNEKINEEEDEMIETEQKHKEHFNKEVYEKNSEKYVEKAVETKHPPKQERKVGRPKKQHVVKEEQQRVLRSLPSRQPGNKITKKTRKTERQIKSRYPKRRTARGGRGGRGKKLKILIDLSKEDSGPSEVLELESDSSRQTVASKADKDELAEEDDDDVKEIDKDKEEIEEQSQTAQESPHPSCPSEDEDEEDGKEHPETDVSAIAEEDVKQESKNPSAKTEHSNPPNSQRCDSPEIKDVEETLKNIKKEVDEDETRLRQPPQLVCMATEDRSMDKLFLESSQGKSVTNSARSSSEGQLSPMYLHANGMEDSETPSPPKLKRTSNTKYHRSFSGESSSSDFMAIDSDDPDGKLVIDMDPPENPPENTDNENEIKEDNSHADETPQPPGQIETKPVESEEASKVKESVGDDDCVVIKPRPRSPVEVIDLVIKQKPTNQSDQHSLLKEKLLEKPILKKVEDQLLEMQRAVMTPGSGDKCASKAEQDESILRTLLLESEVMASTSGADGNAPSISSVIGLPGQEATANLDFLKNVDTKIGQIPSFPTDPPIGLNDAIKLLKYQSYHDAYSSSPETFDDSPKQVKDGAAPPGTNQADSKESIAKDPQQLKEKIKKLKNEITYLQMMAEQKEKEKIAIVCFKRYKEEILRRIYKAYVYSVQDHVRDWIFSRRENSGENRLSSESSPNAHKVHRSESSRISEAARIAAESCKDLYPVPAPAHAATNHRPQSIHSPQSLPKNHRNPQQTGEKVSTIETMVAKATENYGLDMRNLRDGLRTSPDAPVVSGTILQKVLSSSSSQNSSPDQHRSWSPERAHKKNGGTTKPIQPLVSKPYTEPYAAPLDMIMPHKESSHKNSELYRNSPEVPRPAKPFQGSERSQIQSLLSEPVHLKANRNPYRAWSIQAGGRISEDRTKHSKPVGSVLRHSPNTSAQTNPTNVESPLQRQLNSHKVVSRPNFAIPSSLETTNYSQQSSLLGERGERTSSLIVGEQAHEKKPSEDRPQHNFGSTPLSSNSTMPYGGHIIRNNSSPLTTTVSSNKTSISAAQGSSNTSNSTSSTPLCMGCGVSDAKFLCSGCRKHWYCSPQCQSLRWPEHSRVCAGRMFSQSASSYS